MEVFQHTLVQMLMLFAIMLCGFLARKKRLTDDTFDAALSKLVMTFTLPATILDSVLSDANLPSDDVILMTLGYSAIYFVVVCVFAFVMGRTVYRRLSRPVRGVHEFMMVFGNTGFIGFAVISAIMGPDSVLYAAIYNIPYNVFMFSIGMLFIAKTGDPDSPGARADVKVQLRRIGKQLLSPCLISCFLAIVLALLRITDDGYVGQTCNLLGQMTAPAAMLVIGSTLAKMPLRDMLTDGWSYVSTAMRLAVMPLLLFVLGGLFISDSYTLAIIAIESAMPVASSGIMMCLAYGGDTRAMSRGTFLTTVLSLVTLPLIAVLVV